MKIRSPKNLNNKESLKFLLSDALLYGGANAFSKAFSLVTFPLIARHFSVEEFGTFDFFAVLASLLATLIIFGQDSSVARYFYEHENTTKRQELISQSFLLQLVFGGLCVVFLLIFADLIIYLVIDIPEASNYLHLVIIQAPFLVILNFSQNLLKWTFERNSFLFISLGVTISSTFLLLVAIYWLDAGMIEVLWVGVVNSAFFSLLGLWLVRKWIIIPKEFGFLRVLIKYAFPIGIICSIGAVIPATERWLITELLSFDDLGKYAAGARFAMLIALVVSAFQTAWGPFSLSLYKQENAIQIYNLVLKIFVLLVIFFSFLIAGGAFPLIVFLATERYSEGAVVVLPLAFGLSIQSVGWIFEIGISISKRSYLQLYAYFMYLFATILFIYLFASFLGIFGIALGTLAGHVTKTLIASRLAQAAYPMNWDFKPVFLYIGFAIIFGLGTVLIIEPLTDIWKCIVLSMLGLVLTIGGMTFLFSSGELLRVKQTLFNKYRLKLGR
ncbi:oligosaccharide flippase family protein [Rhodobacteraceae bacterium]|nr:oligosaccharide flippase family protein [Paracoccaceae bacterium]